MSKTISIFAPAFRDRGVFVKEKNRIFDILDKCKKEKQGKVTPGQFNGL